MAFNSLIGRKVAKHLYATFTRQWVEFFQFHQNHYSLLRRKF